MIRSQYVRDILELLLDGDEEGIALKNQVNFLSDSNYHYTGFGLFLKFSKLEEISKHKIATRSSFLDGVNIHSPELEVGAQAVLHLNDGVIQEMEIHSLGGEYPKRDLSVYTMTQVWNGSPQKTITRNAK